MTETGSPVIECRNLWEMLGERETEALAALRERGLGKAELRQTSPEDIARLPMDRCAPGGGC